MNRSHVSVQVLPLCEQLLLEVSTGETTERDSGPNGEVAGVFEEAGIVEEGSGK